MRFRSARFIDSFIAGLLGAAVLGLLLPTSGQIAGILGWASKIGIGLLFFLYGARLSTHEVMAGFRQWPLHLTIMMLTFVCFPALGVAIGMVFDSFLPEDLVAGLVFVTLISATTQSSVSNTVTARGNVPAAIIATSASSVLGVFMTPLLVALTLATTGATRIDLGAVVTITAQLLVPFLAGQLAHPRIGGVLCRKGQALMRVDRSLILFVVFAAFSKGSGAGIWGSVSVSQFAVLLTLCVVLLVVAMTFANAAGKVLRFSREDRAVVTFVGTSKSVAVGLPMATVLFAGNQTALIILPLMCFFQLQTIVSSFVAQQLGRHARDEVPEQSEPSAPSPVCKVLLHRLQLQNGDTDAIACIFVEDKELTRTAPRPTDIATSGMCHNDPHLQRQRGTRTDIFVAGNVGALVADANARPAVERFATSARAIDDELQLIDELRSAGMLDDGPGADETVAALLAAAADHPIRVVAVDTRADRSAGSIRDRLAIANREVATVVTQALAELSPGSKMVTLVGGGDVGADWDDNLFSGIDFHPGDALYYRQHLHTVDAIRQRRVGACARAAATPDGATCVGNVVAE